jgi:tyrosine-specific transport protein
MEKKGTILGATFLVAGTCIGGGMLALPVATGAMGFFPSLFLMLVGWGFMTLTALFLTEVNLWMEEGAHIITMASRLLGPIGKATAWVLYLFIGYASLVAYTAGCGDLITAAARSTLGWEISQTWSFVLFICIFGFILYLGNVILGRINTILMSGLIIAYILLIALGVNHTQWRHLLRMSWGDSLIAIPLLLTIFSFQTIVPSLTLYLKQDAKALRLSIILGTTGALIVYLLWEWLVLGSVIYDGDQGLAAALAQGKPATQFLGSAVGSKYIGALADFFAFFALVTSFLGIALGLFDFLSDGLKIKRKGWGNILLGLLVALPTLFFALRFENIFLKALDATGGIGDAILNGMIPALMLWIGRYHKKFTSEYRIPGGRPLIFLVMVYAAFVFIVEMLGRFGVIISLGG